MPDGSTGILYDLGIHLLDSAYHLFGWPRGVYCECKTLHPFNTVHDRMEILLSYDGGLSVRLHASQCACAPAPSLICHGTEGTYLKQVCDIQETLLNQGLTPRDPRWRGERPEEWGILSLRNGDCAPYPTVNGDYGAFYRDLYPALLGDGRPPVTGEEATKVLRLLEGSLRSAEEKRVIEL